MSVKPRAKRKGPAKAAPPKTTEEKVSAIPDIGEVLRRLRLQRHLTVRDVADACGLSRSFVSLVERGDSDISLGRLLRIAEFYEHDLGSLLGYTSRVANARFVAPNERASIDRGRGIDYEVVRLPGLEIELNFMTLNPRRAFKDAISHEGFDVLIAIKGEVTLTLAGKDYPMREGDIVHYSAAYRHTLANKTDRTAIVLGITTGQMR